jgi:DNA replication protein DnaC
MKKITAMPSTAEILNCEKHGDYKAKYSPIFRGKIWVNEMCGECIVEADKLDKEKKENEFNELQKNNAIQRKKNNRINAGISKRNLYKTFDDYICDTEGQTKAKNDCVRYVSEFPTDKSLIMVGGVGTGKTLLASAMLESLVDNNRCEMIKVIDMIRELKSTWSKDSEQTEEGLIKYFCKLDLLVLDEVGSQFGSDTEKLFIFDVIDGRYQDMLPTILISNLDIDGVKEVVGERCVDRLREGGGSMIAFNWNSSRS